MHQKPQNVRLALFFVICWILHVVLVWPAGSLPLALGPPY